jgi:hypothetical protein
MVHGVEQEASTCKAARWSGLPWRPFLRCVVCYQLDSALPVISIVLLLQVVCALQPVPVPLPQPQCQEPRQPQGLCFRPLPGRSSSCSSNRGACIPTGLRHRANSNGSSGGGASSRCSCDKPSSSSGSSRCGSSASRR